MTHRADLNTDFASGDRQALVSLMLQYIDDGVVAAHMNIIHGGVDLFTGHRAYIAGMEAYLANNGGGRFVPLPLWDPASPIPAEFNVVKADDSGNPRPALVNLAPNMPLPTMFRSPALCSFQSGGALGNAINGWHGSVHTTIDGTMGDIMISPSAPIFWCWHAFLDHVFWDWQNCLAPAAPAPAPPPTTQPPAPPVPAAPPPEFPHGHDKRPEHRDHYHALAHWSRENYGEEKQTAQYQ